MRVCPVCTTTHPDTAQRCSHCSSPLETSSQPPAAHGRRGTVVLIGPLGAGKSTVGKLLGELLGLPSVSLDKVAEPYYKEAGHSWERFRALRDDQGFLAAYRYWWPSLAHAAERVLADHPGCVIDFGGGHAHYEDPALFERVRRALAKVEHVVLLLPCADPDRAVATLKARNDSRDRWPLVHDSYDFFERWVKDPCHARLATTTVYTDGRTAEETAREIAESLQRMDTSSAKAPDMVTTHQ